MTVRFGSRPASVPAYTRQFQTLGPTASLLKVDTGRLPEVEPAGAIVPKIFEALGQMAGAAATAGEPAEEPASWQEQLADMPTDAEAMARADPANRDLALNIALETAYGAGKDVQFGDMAERIYAKNEADLEAFEADWQNLKTSALDTLAPSWKPIAEAEFDRRKALYVPRIAANIRTQAEGEANADLREAADAYTVRAAVAAHDEDAGELAETLRRFEAAISARTDLAPEEKAKARLDLQSGVATQAALGRFDRALKDKGLEGAAQFAADFAAGRAGGGDKLAEEWRAPIARALEAHLADAREADAQARLAAATKAKVEGAKRLTAVEKSIGENTYGMADLERDAQAGMFDGLDGDVSSRLSKAIAEARQARAAKTEAAARGAEAFAGGIPLDPTNPEDGAAIDAWWEADPGKEPAGAIEAARRTGILPGPARNAIADGLIYGTPEKRAEAARALFDLAKAAPAVAETLPAQLRAEATRIVKRIDQGHTPESATKNTDAALEGVSEAILKGGAGRDLLEAQADNAAQAEPEEGQRTAAAAPLTASDMGDDALVGYDPGDQLAMGSVRGVYGLVRSRAESVGRYLKQRLRGRETEDGPVIPPVPPELIINLVRDRLRESGKHKVEIEAKDLGSEVEPGRALEAFVDAAFSSEILPNPNFEAQLNLPEVEEDLVKRILTEGGPDLTGYRRAIDVGHIRHAISHHGGDDEEARGQQPIDRGALGLYLDIVKSPDKISVRNRGRQPTHLISEKRVNGWVVVVEEARTRAKTLSFVTMWIRKAE